MDPGDRQWLRQCLGVATTAAIVSEHGERAGCVRPCSLPLSPATDRARDRGRPRLRIRHRAMSRRGGRRRLGRTARRGHHVAPVRTTSADPLPRSESAGSVTGRRTSSWGPPPGGVMRNGCAASRWGTRFGAIHFASLVGEGRWDGSVPPTVWSVLAAVGSPRLHAGRGRRRCGGAGPADRSWPTRGGVAGRQRRGISAPALMAGRLIERSTAGQPRFTTLDRRGDGAAVPVGTVHGCIRSPPTRSSGGPANGSTCTRWRRRATSTRWPRRSRPTASTATQSTEGVRPDGARW